MTIEIGKSPQLSIDSPQYGTSPRLSKSSRKSSASENYLSSPHKVGGSEHKRKSSTASSTGYITTEAYNSAATNRPLSKSIDANKGVYDEETPLYPNGELLNSWYNMYPACTIS